VVVLLVPEAQVNAEVTVGVTPEDAAESEEEEEASTGAPPPPSPESPLADPPETDAASLLDDPPDTEAEDGTKEEWEFDRSEKESGAPSGTPTSSTTLLVYFLAGLEFRLGRNDFGFFFLEDDDRPFRLNDGSFLNGDDMVIVDLPAFDGAAWFAMEALGRCFPNILLLSRVSCQSSEEKDIK